MHHTNSDGPDKTRGERFTLTLETLPTDPRPGVIRLRAALKFLLRVCGLRCITCHTGFGMPVEVHE